MKQVLSTALVLIMLTTVAPAGHAAWGWPPPGYSVAGVRFSDGSQYRGLCAWLRDRRHGVGPGCAPVGQVPSGAGSLQGQTGVPGMLESTPQLPTQVSVSHP